MMNSTGLWAFVAMLIVWGIIDWIEIAELRTDVRELQQVVHITDGID